MLGNHVVLFCVNRSSILVPLDWGRWEAVSYHFIAQWFQLQLKSYPVTQQISLQPTLVCKKRGRNWKLKCGAASASWNSGTEGEAWRFCTTGASGGGVADGRGASESRNLNLAKHVFSNELTLHFQEGNFLFGTVRILCPNGIFTMIFHGGSVDDKVIVIVVIAFHVFDALTYFYVVSVPINTMVLMLSLVNLSIYWTQKSNYGISAFRIRYLFIQKLDFYSF